MNEYIIEYSQLLKVINYKSAYTISCSSRRRVKKQCYDDIFPDIFALLIFILSYLKSNPLKQTHGATFNLKQPQINQQYNCFKRMNNKTNIKFIK